MKSYQERPCAECPWRRDAPVGHFPPERFQDLARTAHDMNIVQFACHISDEDAPIGCAGFVLRGATHNLGVRLAMRSGSLQPDRVQSPYPLFDNYRQMAIANGVSPDDPVLADCRDPD